MKRRSVFQYALRSIFRQRVRNVFIVLIVCTTCVFSLFTAGVFEGKNDRIIRAIIETETGDFQILEKNFFLLDDPQRPGVLTRDLQEKLKAYSYTPELVLKTTILNPLGTQELTLIGADPVSHEKIFPLKDHVTGEWPLSTPKGVVIGKRFAEKLHLKIGEELIITYQDETRAILTEALPVVGVYHHFGPGFEGSHAYVLRGVIQGLLHLPPVDSFHRITLLGKGHPSVSDPNLTVRSWQELHPELSVLLRFHDGITRVLIIFMLVIAFVAIATPINILWDERRDEVKLLQTIGAKARTLYAIAAAEAFVLAVTSLVLATSLWGVIHYVSKRHGLDFSLLGEADVVRGGILLTSKIYPVVNTTHLMIILFFHGSLILGGQLWATRRVLQGAYE